MSSDGTELELSVCVILKIRLVNNVAVRYNRCL